MLFELSCPLLFNLCCLRLNTGETLSKVSLQGFREGQTRKRLPCYGELACLRLSYQFLFAGQGLAPIFRALTVLVSDRLTIAYPVYRKVRPPPFATPKTRAIVHVVPAVAGGVFADGNCPGRPARSERRQSHGLVSGFAHREGPQFPDHCTHEQARRLSSCKCAGSSGERRSCGYGWRVRAGGRFRAGPPTTIARARRVQRGILQRTQIRS